MSIKVVFLTNTFPVNSLMAISQWVTLAQMWTVSLDKKLKEEKEEMLVLSCVCVCVS